MKIVANGIAGLLLIATVSFSAEKMGDFTLKGIDGKNFTFSKNVSGVAVVNFWATWCGPCIAEMESYKPLFAELAPKGVSFISISIDDAKSSAKVSSFAKSRKFPNTILLDPAQEASRKFQVGNPPLVLVVDKEGLVVLRHAGYAKGDEAEVRAAVLKALGE